jgi:serine/threonine-protein kinase
MTPDRPEHDSTRTATGLSAQDFDAPEHARFAPGQIFASRYRIISLLGRGGMGEVYRADDLKLGQRVALKLLALQSAVVSNPMERFVTEVRLARRIAHPNVCRVYDIGEADGWHYLSMEYVDGETLASLLRRIGRLPVEKAIDIAGQLCAGLAAAHERGILHRDLKPANVMVDGRGYVRIMDFGLAVRSDASTVHEVAGTPGYMAPEQLAGGKVTVQSDLYALGRVLYELFCGRRYDPSVGYPFDIDSRIATAIDACMATKPAERPASASTVAAMLPGADPIAAAVADGRMLSPNMLAAAGGGGALRPSLAWALLVIAITAITAVATQGYRLTFSSVDVPKSPEVLAERAQQILADVGYTSTPVDNEFRLTSQSAGAFRIRFVYRQGSQYLIPRNLFHLVVDDDPPADLAGMATVNLRADGRLVSLRVTPEDNVRGHDQAADAEWRMLFNAAGLNYSEFERAEPAHTLAVGHDAALAWEKRFGSSPATAVTAASLGGRPVFFEFGDSPTDASRDVLSSFRSWGVEVLLSLFIVLAFVAAGILALRNLRNREGDRIGARRLTVFVACGGVLMAVMRAHHVPVALAEWTLLLGSTGWVLVWAAFSWLTYIGLEPYVRRQWPSTLISWARVLAGRLRDPLVGRDVLVGIVAGSALVLLLVAHFWLTNSAPPEVFAGPALESVRSPRHLIAALAFDVTDALQFALGGLFLLVLIRLLVRNTWLAASAWIWLVMPLSSGIALNVESAFFVQDLILSLVIGVLAVAILLRFGLLTAWVTLTVERMLTRIPLTLNVRAWYLETSLAIVILLTMLATYGFVVALGRRLSGERPA